MKNASMDTVTRTITYAGSRAELTQLTDLLKQEGVQVRPDDFPPPASKPPPSTWARLNAEAARILKPINRILDRSFGGKHDGPDLASPLAYLLQDGNEIAVQMVATGGALAIASAIKRFRQRGAHARVEVNDDNIAPAENPADAPEK